ncbi:hypothetical protein NEOLEDRAFT_1129050, partial [Neolentinus lepideus HHB14362 ss-1]
HGYRGNASIGLKKWTRLDALSFILPLPTILSSMQRPVFTGVALYMTVTGL